MSKLLLITGANKSIGYAIADLTMHKNLPFNILLCARDAKRGQDAVDALKLQHPTFAENLELGIVDISSEASVVTFTEWFKTKYSKVDILLNNAGVLTYPDATGNTHEGITVDTFHTNFFGTTNFAKHMQPLVADNGKILFMGSIAGPDAFRKCNEALQARFLDTNLTQEDFTEWARDYIEDVKKGVWKEKGYCVWEYGMSKLFLQSYLSALSRSDDIVARGVQCYSMHPGLIQTELNGNASYKPVIEGTRSAMKLIEREFKVDPVEQGGFFHEDGSFLRLGEPFDLVLK